MSDDTRPDAAVDFGRTARDYARHRAGFPDEFFDRLERAGIRPGRGAARALDLGTGTGTLARGLARRGWRATGIDLSPDMIAAARELSAGLDIDYRVGPAEATGLPGRGFKLITAGTCWHWFDRPAAAGEARRLLVAGGWLVIAAMDWGDKSDDALALLWRLIKKYNPGWRELGGSGLQMAWAEELTAAGFALVDRFQFGIDVPYSQEAWRGRVRASTYVGASLAPDEIAAFDDEHRRLLAERFADGDLNVPHRISAILARAA